MAQWLRDGKAFWRFNIQVLVGFISSSMVYLTLSMKVVTSIPFATLKYQLKYNTGWGLEASLF